MGRPRKSKYIPDEEAPLEQIQEKLHKTYKQIVTGEEGNQSVNDNPTTQIVWKQQVHDSLQYVLEKGDELQERIETNEKKLQILGEDYTAVKQLTNQYEGELSEVTSLKKEVNNLRENQEQVISDLKKEIRNQLSDVATSTPQVDLVIQDENLEKIRTTCSDLSAQLEEIVFQKLSLQMDRKIREIVDEKLHNFQEQMEENLNIIQCNEKKLFENIKTINERLKYVEKQSSTLEDAVLKIDEDLSAHKAETERTRVELIRKMDATTRPAIRASTLMPNALETTFHTPTRGVKLRPPSFKASSEDKPMKYIKELKRYIKATALDHQEMMCTLSQSLEGSASAWWDVVENSINTFEDFERCFRERYWNDIIQDDWSRKIEYGHYNQNGRWTRIEYATNLWGFAKDLSRDFSEEELVRKLSSHFDWDIRYAVRGQGIKSQSKLFELLSLKDTEFEQKQQQRQRYEKTAQNVGQSNTTTQEPKASTGQGYKSNFDVKKGQSQAKTWMSKNPNISENQQAKRLHNLEAAKKYDELDVLNIELEDKQKKKLGENPGNGI